MSTVAVPEETSTAVGSSSAPNCPSTIRTGDLVVDLNTRVVAVNDKPVHLTGKEYGILELFSLRKGTTLTKEMFLNHLYGGMDEPELKIIDVFVCKLRKKLAQATGGYHYIETIWGRGYVLRDPAPTPAVTLVVGAEDRDARNDETGSCLTERFETAASHRRAAPVAPQRRQRHGGLRRSLPRGTRFSL